MNALPYSLSAESTASSNGSAGFSGLISTLMADCTRLIEQYFALLKIEIRAEGQRLMQIALYGTVMLVLAQFVILFAGLALLMGLVQSHYSWLAATGITLGVFVLLTLACGVYCMDKLKAAQAIWKAATQ